MPIVDGDTQDLPMHLDASRLVLSTDQANDGDYLVSWTSIRCGDAFTLQEDDNAAFSSPVTRFSRASTVYTISGQDSGTWYYRVRASSMDGDSD